MSYKSIPWHFRNNKNRKKGKKNKGKHPSLVVGVTADNENYINIGLTHQKKRGHHNNIQISNPQNWKEKSYLRDDVREDPKRLMDEILIGYNLNPKDIKKVHKLIEKYKKKNSR
ncbi:MAG: hypothetical protein E7177_07760 [Erysipelotrichaceae bacterium]|nr:hypothetical protein [Erysipelotrichaceae bacterium]